MSWCFLDELYRVIESRRDKPVEGSYTSSLMSKGLEAVIDKVVEECMELVDSARGGSKSEIVHEASDLIYHTLVLLAYLQIPSSMVPEELIRRRRRGHGGRRKPG